MYELMEDKLLIMKYKLLNIFLEHYRSEIESDQENAVNVIKDIEEFVDDIERCAYRIVIWNFGPLINFPRGIKARFNRMDYKRCEEGVIGDIYG